MSNPKSEIRNPNSELSCPVPLSEYPKVLLAHGGGGKLMHDLIKKMLMPPLANELLEQNHDSTVMELNGQKIAFTTDSYVVQPIFFPGGDIGTLAVNGTVNDLSMSGAEPLYLSIGLIIEEGFPMEDLARITESVKLAAQQAGIRIVTGDTKVVDKGKGDGIFINTAGIGVINHELKITPGSIRSGDVIILNGDIGRHGMAIMAAREGLGFDTTIESDCAPLNGLVRDIVSSGVQVHCMRDLTRGGLVSALNELSEDSNSEILIEEDSIPVREEIQGACEILGFDPLYVANEGKLVIFVPEKHANKCLGVMKEHRHGKDSAVIGKVLSIGKNIVKLKSKIGTTRILDMLSGEQLPRIC
jgi:hydrogenase expression/formation protein HypE